MQIEQFAVYEARVSIRRGDGWSVKPEAEALDGQIIEVESGWPITEEDRKQYAGEWAMIMREGPIAWIASGDLKDMKRKEGDVN